MKQNLPVTGKEKLFDEHNALVSTTNPKGIISYANQHFIEISGYSIDELYNKPHNMIRHPDMPQAAFADLWETIKSKKPWMGIVKNRCKNGDHYWVDAYITPIYDKQNIIGYQSVRSKPTRQFVDNASRLYQQINSGKKSIVQQRLGMTAKFFAAYTLSLVPMLAVLNLMQTVETSALLLSVAAAVISAWLLIYSVCKPWREAAKESENIFNNPIAKQVYTGRHDELGQLQIAIKALRSQAKTITTRVSENAAELAQVAEQTNSIVEQTDRSVQKQRQDIESVSSAVQEMTTSIEDVAKNTAHTAQASKQADEQVVEGKGIMDEASLHIKELAKQVETTSTVVAKLKEDSYTIGGVVDVIRGIADQTNLLALNAAIEAARAGSAGRGFAVVADQVRTLATQTRESTEEIQGMIDSFQHSTDKAVDEMEIGREKAELSVDQMTKANDALDAISESVSAINDMSLQIASTSEQQSHVADEINRTILSINESSLETAQVSKETASASEKLIKQAQGLQTLSVQFGQ